MVAVSSEKLSEIRLGSIGHNKVVPGMVITGTPMNPVITYPTPRLLYPIVQEILDQIKDSTRGLDLA